LRSLAPANNIAMPSEPRTTEDDSGTELNDALKVPDCELVMLRPEPKSAAEHALPFDTKSGQKYSWIFCGVGVMPFGRLEVRNSEKPPV